MPSARLHVLAPSQSQSRSTSTHEAPRMALLSNMFIDMWILWYTTTTATENLGPMILSLSWYALQGDTRNF